MNTSEGLTKPIGTGLCAFYPRSAGSKRLGRWVRIFAAGLADCSGRAVNTPQFHSHGNRERRKRKKWHVTSSHLKSS